MYNTYSGSSALSMHLQAAFSTRWLFSQTHPWEQRCQAYPMLGKLAGETTIHSVVDRVHLRERWLREQLGWPRRFPCNATYTRVLAACDAEELARMIAEVFIKASSQEAARRSQPTKRQ